MVTAIFIAIFALALLGVPMFALFGGAAIALFLSLPEGAWASAAIDVFSSQFGDSPILMTIPLFTFAGYMMAASRAPQRLIDVSRAWIGWIPGGLAIVCLLTSTFFATLTGGSGVTIVAVGGLLYPALTAEKYPQKFSIGMITTAGALGALLPPSFLLILYGIIAGLSIDRVLVAGIFAGLITTLALAIYAGIEGHRAGVPRVPFVLKEALRTLWIAKWEAAIPIVLIGGLVSGLLRIGEASAFTAVYVLFIEVFIYRDITIRKDLPRVIVESMTMIGAVLVILATAVSFCGWMIQAEIPTYLFDLIDDHIHSKFTFLLALNVFLIAVGMFTDGATAVIVIVPLILPMARAFGIDPYHLAVIFLLNLEMGFLIPPVGMNLFISSIRFGRTVSYVTKSVMPFLAVLTVVLALVTYVPWISTFLPSLIDTDDLTAGFGDGSTGASDDSPDIDLGDDEQDALPDAGDIDLGGLDLDDDAGADEEL